MSTLNNLPADDVLALALSKYAQGRHPDSLALRRVKTLLGAVSDLRNHVAADYQAVVDASRAVIREGDLDDAEVATDALLVGLAALTGYRASLAVVILGEGGDLDEQD